DKLAFPTAVAPAPGPPPQPHGQPPRPADAGGEAILDRAIDPRRDIEQRAPKHLERVLDLVDRRRAARPGVVVAIEPQDVGSERRPDPRPPGRFLLVEQLRDPRQVIERRA